MPWRGEERDREKEREGDPPRKTLERRSRAMTYALLRYNRDGGGLADEYWGFRQGSD